MRAGRPEVPQQVGVGAAGLLQRVGQHGDALGVELARGQGALLVGPTGCAASWRGPARSCAGRAPGWRRRWPRSSWCPRRCRSARSRGGALLRGAAGEGEEGRL